MFLWFCFQCCKEKVYFLPVKVSVGITVWSISVTQMWFYIYMCDPMITLYTIIFRGLMHLLLQFSNENISN